jgi:hypothetical protein
MIDDGGDRGTGSLLRTGEYVDHLVSVAAFLAAPEI